MDGVWTKKPDYRPFRPNPSRGTWRAPIATGHHGRHLQRLRL